MKYTSKLTKRGIKMLLTGSFRNKKTKAYIIFYQKKRILKKIAVNMTLNGGSDSCTIKTAPAHMEVTHKCYVNRVVLIFNKTPILEFFFEENQSLNISESLTMTGITLGI